MANEPDPRCRCDDPPCPLHHGPGVPGESGFSHPEIPKKGVDEIVARVQEDEQLQAGAAAWETFKEEHVLNPSKRIVMLDLAELAFLSGYLKGREDEERLWSNIDPFEGPEP